RRLASFGAAGTRAALGAARLAAGRAVAAARVGVDRRRRWRNAGRRTGRVLVPACDAGRRRELRDSRAAAPRDGAREGGGRARDEEAGGGRPVALPVRGVLLLGAQARARAAARGRPRDCAAIR